MTLTNPPFKIPKLWNRLINYADNKTRNPFLVDISRGSQQLGWLSLGYFLEEDASVKLTTDSMEMLSEGISSRKFDPTI